MKSRNKKIIAAAGMFLLAAAGTGVTLGYLNAGESVVNTFTVGDLKLGLQEPEWEPEKGDGQNIFPGYSVYKNPTIKNITPGNNGEQTCYVRMCISICNGNGEDITDNTALELIKSTLRYDDSYNGTYDQKGEGQKITEGRIPGYSLRELEKLPMINPVFAIDESRSSANRIVCNYMGESDRGLFHIGDEAVLFTDIAIPIHWTGQEMEKAGDFQIIVSAEAIQSAGFSSQEEAFSALDVELAGGKQA
ncbi:MAG: SipW-dependent-type signal peptide-containing protein [Eubacteriales bacterium]|nr:SipW-dependent-type signal peptide-containing protein [Eubacteriales bacterium]